MAIEHIVVLMMENRSYDHMLGYHLGSLKGLTQSTDCGGGGTTIEVTDDADDAIPISPAHSIGAVNQQLFCTPYPPGGDVEPPMTGFVVNYETVMDTDTSKTKARFSDVTRCFGAGSPSEKQPTNLWRLASTYTVCDQWFSSVPGPTTPNRLFANCATSGGYGGDKYYLEDLPDSLASTPSIFGLLRAHDRTWAIYYEDANFVTEMVLDDVKQHLDCCHLDSPVNGSKIGLSKFMAAVGKGQLANYTFLTPSLWGDSQHPPASIRAGDDLIGAVAGAIEGSPLWDSTLLLIVYDEHGGLYDHVAPPSGIAYDGPQWDSSVPADFGFTLPSFDFTRLGARVPAVVVSANTANAVDSTVYEHSSIVATVCDAFGLPSLTTPHRTAASFLGLASNRS